MGGVANAGNNKVAGTGTKFGVYKSMPKKNRVMGVLGGVAGLGIIGLGALLYKNFHNKNSKSVSDNKQNNNENLQSKLNNDNNNGGQVKEDQEEEEERKNKDFVVLDSNVGKDVAIDLPVNILVVSDSRDLRRKFCGLLSVNQKNKPLGEIMRCRKDWLPGIVYAPSNNTNLRFVSFSLDDFLNIDNLEGYDEKFLVDNLSYVFYITDKKNFKLGNIKEFYDKLNLIWCGKENYGEGYSNYGIKKDNWFREKLETLKNKNTCLLHRYIIFALVDDDPKELIELLSGDKYEDVISYIQGMPDARQIPIYTFSDNFTICCDVKNWSNSILDDINMTASGVPKAGTKECAQLENIRLLPNDFGCLWSIKKFLGRRVDETSFNNDGEDFFH